MCTENVQGENLPTSEKVRCDGGFRDFGTFGTLGTLIFGSVPLFYLRGYYTG